MSIITLSNCLSRDEVLVVSLKRNLKPRDIVEFEASNYKHLLFRFIIYLPFCTRTLLRWPAATCKSATCLLP
jgi:hypothetical protein